MSLHLIGLVNCDKDRDAEDEDNDDEPLDLDDQDLEELLQDSSKVVDEADPQSAEKRRRKIVRRKSSYLLGNKKIDEKLWNLFMKQSKTNTDKIRLEENKKFFYKMVYYNGIEHSLRQKVSLYWPLIDLIFVNLIERFVLIQDLAIFVGALCH